MILGTLSRDVFSEGARFFFYKKEALSVVILEKKEALSVVILGT